MSWKCLLGIRIIINLLNCLELLRLEITPSKKLFCQWTHYAQIALIKCVLNRTNAQALNEGNTAIFAKIP